DLWKSDGTSGGTTLAVNLPDPAVSGTPENPVDVNGTLHFLALDESGESRVWTSNGTSEGTFPLDTPIMPRRIFASAETLYATTHDAAHGLSLWRINGNGSVRFLRSFPATGPGVLDVVQAS